MNIKITNNLKWLITKAGMQQKDIAQEMGVTPQQFTGWVKGKTFMRIDKIIELLFILRRRLGNDLTLDDLFEYKKVIDYEENNDNFF